MDRQRIWAALTGVAGVLALAITVAFTMLPQVKAAGACTSSTAVIQFELATTAADLTPIFHAPDDPCRAKAVAAMDAVNHLDVAAYIPAYTAFAILAAVFLAGGALRPLALAAIAAALAALAADYVETVTLLAITPSLDTAQGLLARSSTAAWTKFAMLALNGLFLAALCFKAQPRRRILGALLVLPALGTVAMALNRSLLPLNSLAYMASWTPLMLIAIRDAVRGKK